MLLLQISGFKQNKYELILIERRKNDIHEELHLMVRTNLNQGNAYKC